MPRPELNRLATHSGLEPFREFVQFYAGRAVGTLPGAWSEWLQSLYDDGVLIVDLDPKGRVLATYRKAPQ